MERIRKRPGSEIAKSAFLKIAIIRGFFKEPRLVGTMGVFERKFALPELSAGFESLKQTD